MSQSDDWDLYLVLFTRTSGDYIIKHKPRGLKIYFHSVFIHHWIFTFIVYEFFDCWLRFCLCQVIPRWHEHWTSNKVYDGDMIVLQGQEKIFLSKSMEGSDIDINKQYTTLTFTPTQADRFVLAFRNWLRRHGNSQPEWFGFSGQQPLPSTVLSKRQVQVTFNICISKCQHKFKFSLEIIFGAIHLSLRRDG